jgi:hypothetical protein
MFPTAEAILSLVGGVVIIGLGVVLFAVGKLISFIRHRP